MADTAHKTEEEVREHFDEPQVLRSKVKLLASWLRESKHAIAFTGAGVSTSTGIPDFRSGMNTVLETGPGAWTLRAEMQKADSQQRLPPMQARSRHVSTLSAIPSKTHMAFVELQRRGILKHVISQNTDGLHRRSGFPTEHLSELHGNSNLEVCRKCGREYMRDFSCRRHSNHVHSHHTGRFCSVHGCGGELHDSIINFGENLPEKALNDGFDQSSRADLCLAMGSSLRVSPACHMPRDVARNPKARLVIVNLQGTPYDEIAALRINGKCDQVMEMLMTELALPIPSFTLRRYVRVTASRDSSGGACDVNIEVRGEDSDGTPASLFTTVAAQVACGKVKGPMVTMAAEPFRACVRSPDTAADSQNATVVVQAAFRGHYNEPPCMLQLSIHAAGACSEAVFMLEYNPELGGSWGVSPVPERANRKVAEAPSLTTAHSDHACDRDGAASGMAPALHSCPHEHAHIVSVNSEVARRLRELNLFPEGPATVDANGDSKEAPRVGDADEARALRTAQCSHAGCSVRNETWLCVHPDCMKVLCGRFARGHMVNHAHESGHYCAVGLADLSLWCYGCENYLHHLHVRSWYELYSELHRIKFSAPPPAPFGSDSS